MTPAGRIVLVLMVTSLFIAAGTSPAMATDAVACGVTGETGSLTPPVRFTGGSGSFTFGGQGVCTVNGEVPSPATITASGWYVNTLCPGFMTWDGSLSVSTAGRQYNNVPFHIEVVAGFGDMNINNGAAYGGFDFTPTAPGTDLIICTNRWLVSGSFDLDM
jgi:hypothetical protein